MNGRTVEGDILPEEFYRTSSDKAARDFLGMILLRRFPDGTVAAGRICETEAYCQDDPASHSFPGLTARNAPMFGPPGRAYVYMIYGIHCCFNVVTGPEGEGSAVLIRGLIPLTGLDFMRRRRGAKVGDSHLCNGPGKICQALDIDRSLNGHSLMNPPLQILSDCFLPEESRIFRTPRIGISKNTEVLRRYVWKGWQ